MRLFIYFIITITLLARSYADPAKLPSADRKALEDLSNFREIHSTANIPSQILSLCGYDNEPIANPGEPWQEGCIVEKVPLPRRRLIWAATDGIRYVIHYECGGRAHSFHFLVTKHSSQTQLTPIVVWRGFPSKTHKPFKDYSAFIIGIKKGTIEDAADRDYR